MCNEQTYSTDLLDPAQFVTHGENFDQLQSHFISTVIPAQTRERERDVKNKTTKLTLTSSIKCRNTLDSEQNFSLNNTKQNKH